MKRRVTCWMRPVSYQLWVNAHSTFQPSRSGTTHSAAQCQLAAGQPAFATSGEGTSDAADGLSRADLGSYPSPGVTLLERLLLTTAPVQSLADTLERIRWYTCRWIIEKYHSFLKIGCGRKKPDSERQAP